MADPQGLAFDPVADDYDRGRPTWPPALLDDVDATTVLDLAAGTGKLTHLLARRFAHVVAVEPSAGMRALITAEADVLEGTAESIPLANATVDAVFVAEAFHWFDAAAAGAEIARVLRPGGTLVVCFNEWREGFQPPIGPDAERALEERWAMLPPPGGPKVAAGTWKAGLTGGAFTPIVERSIDYSWQTDAAGVAAYYVSTSSTAQLPLREREALRSELLERLHAPMYRLDLTTRVYRAART